MGWFGALAPRIGRRSLLWTGKSRLPRLLLLSVAALVAAAQAQAQVDPPVLSRTTLALDEAGSASYGLKLAADPAKAVTVTVTVPAAHEDAATVQAPGGKPGASATLDFDSDNWNREQTVTVRGSRDGDTVGESFGLTHAPGGFSWSGTDPVVDVTITDAGAGLLVSGLTLGDSIGRSLPEGGKATYTVTLKSAPGGTATRRRPTGTIRALIRSVSLLISVR